MLRVSHNLSFGYTILMRARMKFCLVSFHFVLGRFSSSLSPALSFVRWLVRLFANSLAELASAPHFTYPYLTLSFSFLLSTSGAVVLAEVVLLLLVVLLIIDVTTLSFICLVWNVYYTASQLCRSWYSHRRHQIHTTKTIRKPILSSHTLAHIK